MSENEDIISSISKGCFVFKPSTSATPRRAKKRKNKESDSAVNYYGSFPNENNDEQGIRFDTYLSSWKDLESQIKEVRDGLNESVFQDLLHFVQDVHTNQHDSHTLTEIPTAALVTGVNVPDHSAFFSKFISRVKENVTPLVVQLQSTTCSNLKVLIKCAFDSLVPAPDSDSEDEESFSSEDEIEVSSSHARKRKKKKSIFHNYTFTELKEWYQTNCLMDMSTIDIPDEDRSSDGEGENCNDSIKKGRPPVVFIFEDFERFPSTVLQDFILICSEYIVDIPIILVFGVATAVMSVHRLLPHFVSSKLSIQKFQSKPSLICLTEVIDKVIITYRNAFKLGPHVFRLLYEHFLYHDFSINNFVRGLKFCVMEHFSANPSSVMCTKDRGSIEEYIRGLDSKELNNITDVPSFKSYIDRKSQGEQAKLESKPHLLKTQAIALMRKLHEQELVFYPIVKCLYTCTAKLPSYPLGKFLRDTYEYCIISANITKEKRFESAMLLLRMLSRDELLPILESCENILSNELLTARNKKEKPFTEEAESLKELISKFDDLDNAAEEEDVVEGEENKGSSKKSTPVFKSRYEFTEKMKMAVKEKKKTTPYEKLRNSIADCLISIFKKYLQSPLSMTFHEVFYYDDVHMVKQRLNGTPRVAIQKALSNPKCYLQCSCCPSGGDEIRNTMPDVCILYKLHLESGKLINLYDWLQAFTSYIDVSIAGESKKKSQKRKKLEEQIQARFIRGVSELQFLGFIKGTRRKTDHVGRLTWGSC